MTTVDKSGKRRTESAEVATPQLIETIKRTTITSLVSDDTLMQWLVLKGGNAMDIVYQVSPRASVDIDFSVDVGFVYDCAWPRVKSALATGFAEKGYLAFDINMSQRPGKMPEDLADFWGGYLIDFKLISLVRADGLDRDLEAMRREAIRLGEGVRFTIDISNHEYVGDKQAHVIDDYTVYVYSPAMIVSEKLRAICQQMPEYAAIIKRNGLGNQRARDFVDIEALVSHFGVDLGEERLRGMVEQMFNVKRVPLHLLGNIESTEAFHSIGYDEVRATLKPGLPVKPFEYYFNFVLGEVKKLKPLWDV